MDLNVIYGVFLCRAGIQGDFGLLHVRRRCVQYVFLTVSGEENDWETALFSCQFFSCLFCHLEFPQNDLLGTDPVDTSVLKHLPSWFSWINKAQMSRIKTADLNAFRLWNAENIFFCLDIHLATDDRMPHITSSFLQSCCSEFGLALVWGLHVY